MIFYKYVDIMLCSLHSFVNIFSLYLCSFVSHFLYHSISEDIVNKDTYIQTTNISYNILRNHS